jgi:hypothetical protein
MSTTGIPARGVVETLPPMFDTQTPATVTGTKPRKWVDLRKERIGPPWVRFGRSVRYSRDAFARWLAANTHV